jgi:hypothetical protein
LEKDGQQILFLEEMSLIRSSSYLFTRQSPFKQRTANPPQISIFKDKEISCRPNIKPIATG